MRSHAVIHVVIPALNEEQAIARVLAAIPNWVDRVIVADNGSTDATAGVAERHGAVVVREPQRGYGSACLAALAAIDKVTSAPAAAPVPSPEPPAPGTSEPRSAAPDIIVFLDADFSDHPEEMATLVDPILRGEADLVIGSRVLGHRQPGALSPQQRFGNWLATRLLRLIYGVASTDLGPFRAIRYLALLQLDMDDRDYGWTIQMQVRAAKTGLRSIDVPVSYRKRIGTSKISGTLRGVIGAGWKILAILAREARRPSRTA